MSGNWKETSSERTRESKKTNALYSKFYSQKDDLIFIRSKQKFEAQTIINKTDNEEAKLLAKTTCKVSLKCPIKISINFIRSIRFSQFFIII